MAIVTNGLIGYWHYKQGVSGSTWGNIAPATVGSYDGTITGATLQADGMYFDGVDDKIKFPSMTFGFNYCIELFVTFAKINSLNYLLNTNVDSRVFYVQPTRIYTSFPLSIDATYTLPTNTLLHIVCNSANSGTGTDSGLYINGVKIVSKTSILDTITDEFSLMGGYNSNFYSTNGKVASFRIYNRALSSVEIQQNYSVGADNVGLSTIPVEYLAFANGNGASISSSKPTIQSPQQQTPLVTSGLIGYWHYKQGFNSSKWDNIAPSMSGVYDGIVSGAVLQANGVYFDGVDDKVAINGFPNLASYTLEIGIIPPSRGAFYVLSSPQAGGFNLTMSNGSLRYLASVQTIIKVADLNSLNRVSVSSDGTNIRYFSDGAFITQSASNIAFGNGTLNIGSSSTSGSFYVGEIVYIRIYNRNLSDAEIVQNNAVGTAIGLEEPQQGISYLTYCKANGVSTSSSKPTKTRTANDFSSYGKSNGIAVSSAKPMVEVGYASPPQAIIISVDRTKISDEVGVNESTIKFAFDTDVTAWTVNVIGVSHDTGTVADSGGAVTAGKEITAIVDWTELYQEGENRVNIYGYNGAGWTPFEGVIEEPKPISYLQLDGVDDFLYVNQITATEIVIDFTLDEFVSDLTFYVTSSDYMNPISIWNQDGKDKFGYGSTVYYNGALKQSNIEQFVNENKRGTLIITSPSTTGAFYFLANLDAYVFTKGKIWDIKIYNNTNLVAHYDMNTATIQDQSGNGNHAFKSGGEFISS